MHILKTAIYSKLTNIDLKAMFIGLAMDVCMVVGTYVAKYFIKKLDKNKFQKYVAVLLWIVGMYMLIMGTQNKILLIHKSFSHEEFFYFKGWTQCS